MTAGSVLVGRSRERERLDRLVHDLSGRRSAAAILIGDAGVGKSTLLEHAISGAAAAGLTIVSGRGDPFAEGRPPANVLAALDIRLDDPGGTTLLQAPVGDPAIVFAQRLVDALDRHAAERPVLLVLDDLQWLDRTSLTLVQHLATRGREHAVGVVAAARPPESGSAVARLIADLHHDVLTIDPLGRGDVDELLGVRLGGDPGPRLRGEIDAAHGNPMLIDAVLESLIGAGVERLLDGTFELTGDPTGATPASAVARQLRLLEPTTLRLVQTAAIAGRELRVDVLARVLRQSPLDVARRIGAAISAGVIAERDGDLEFRHDLYRDAALESIPSADRSALHTAVAAALTHLGAPALSIADHYALGGQPGDTTAAHHLVGAAAEVVGAAPGIALRLCEAAAGLAPSGPIGIEVQSVTLRALAGCGRITEAEHLAAEMLAADPPSELEAQVRRELALTAFIDGRPADATLHMRRVVALADDRRSRATAHAELAFASLLALDRDGARSNAERAVVEGQQVSALDAVVMGRAVLCWQDMWACDLRAAAEGADALDELISTVPPGAWHAVQPWLAVAGVRLDVDRCDDALDAARRGRQLSIDTGSSWATAVYDALVADTHLRRGRLDEAEHWARTAIEATALIDGFGVEVWARSAMALSLLARGRVDDAVGELAAAEVALDDGRAQFGLDRLFLARARAQELRGDPGAAQTIFRDGWDLMDAIGIVHPLPAFAPGLVRTARRCAERDGAHQVPDHAALAEKLARVEAMAADTGVGSHHLLAAHARAWLEPTPESLDTLRANLGTADAPLLALEAWRDLAELERLLGRTSLAEQAARAAAEIAREMGVGDQHVDPPRARRPRARFGLAALTPAERRVAELVAEGHTNAQIAALLVVSRRTIDSHVLAAYRKLEVSSRVALTRVMLAQAAP